MDTSHLAFPKASASHDRQQRQQARIQSRKALRDHIWRVDGGRCRASGKQLFRDHLHIDHRGEVCHVQSRGAHPERALDPANCILMSALMHILSDGRGGYRLKLFDLQTGEPATDASRPIRFVMHDSAGHVLWERISGRRA